jgi:hypothetical protein
MIVLERAMELVIEIYGLISAFARQELSALT